MATTTVFLSRVFVTVAVRADVNALAVAALEPGNIGPEIPDADREQNSVGFDHRSVAKADVEQLTSLVYRLIDDPAHELDAVLRALGAAESA